MKPYWFCGATKHFYRISTSVSGLASVAGHQWVEASRTCTVCSLFPRPPTSWRFHKSDSRSAAALAAWHPAPACRVVFSSWIFIESDRGSSPQMLSAPFSSKTTFTDRRRLLAINRIETRSEGGWNFFLNFVASELLEIWRRIKLVLFSSVRRPWRGFSITLFEFFPTSGVWRCNFRRKTENDTRLHTGRDKRKDRADHRLVRPILISFLFVFLCVLRVDFFFGGSCARLFSLSSTCSPSKSEAGVGLGERERERERERLRDRVRVVRVGSETHRKTKRQMCVAFCFCFRLDSFFFEKKKNVVSYPSSSRNRAATKWIALTSAPSETEWGRQKIVEKK